MEYWNDGKKEKIERMEYHGGGILEEWNSGNLGKRKAGMLECWNKGQVGFLWFVFLPIIPPFHHSNIPVVLRFRYSNFHL